MTPAVATHPIQHRLHPAERISRGLYRYPLTHGALLIRYVASSTWIVTREDDPSPLPICGVSEWGSLTDAVKGIERVREAARERAA